MITLLTPTYNRRDTLEFVYKSLIRQTNKNFIWMIVDDGSSDNTSKLIKKFISDGLIDIEYYYKDNGGKHTALNYGIKKIKTEYILILDSDDYLKDDSVEIVLSSWKKYNKNKKIGCLSFLKTYPDGKVIGKKYTEKEVVSNHIDFRYNRNLLGDMCEVFKTSILKKYPFPVFDGERFLSEAIIWNKIAYDYDTVYINYPIYIANYMESGLSANSLRLRYKSPNGAMANANMFLDSRFRLTIRMKNAILYDGFALLAHKKILEIIRNSKCKFLSIIFFPLGIVFYIFLIIKFKNSQ